MENYGTEGLIKFEKIRGKICDITQMSYAAHFNLTTKWA